MKDARRVRSLNAIVVKSNAAVGIVRVAAPDDGNGLGLTRRDRDVYRSELRLLIPAE